MIQKKILITGGAGYIGSSIGWALSKKNQIIILDNFSSGNKINISSSWKVYTGSCYDKSIIKKIFKENNISTIIHCAAKISVVESEKNKRNYYLNNFESTKVLVDECLKSKYLERFIFSSSAAVYGKPKYLPIDIYHSLNPLNYYGYTKLICEKYILKKLKNSKIKVSILRYFNVAGVLEGNKCGIINFKNLNLISKLLINIKKKKFKFSIKINNLNKTNLSPERDFIHIKDIIKIYNYILKSKKKINILNCSTCYKTSVLSIISKIENLTKKKIKKKFQKLPKNECNIIFAKSPKNILGRKENISNMILSTYKWINFLYKKKYIN
jgi:UDP-glucose 4-epimerase